MIRLLSSILVLPDMDSGPDHNNSILAAGACHSKGEFAVCVCVFLHADACFYLLLLHSIFCLKPDIKFVSVSDKTS